MLVTLAFSSETVKNDYLQKYLMAVRSVELSVIEILVKLENFAPYPFNLLSLTIIGFLLGLILRSRSQVFYFNLPSKVSVSHLLYEVPK